MTNLHRLYDDCIIDLDGVAAAFHSIEGGRPKVKVVLKAMALGKTGKSDSTVKTNMRITVYDADAERIWEALASRVAIDGEPVGV